MLLENILVFLSVKKRSVGNLFRVSKIYSVIYRNLMHTYYKSCFIFNPSCITQEDLEVGLSFCKRNYSIGVIMYYDVLFLIL